MNSYTLTYYSYIYIGLKVDYKGRVAGIDPGPAVLHCLLLCWTDDHPAQCEVGKFLSSGGVHPCRRDKLEGYRDVELL